MILVAGLAIAGLAGIAAAFYFSMRPDGSRARAVPGSRTRGRVRTGESRRPASRSRTSRTPTGAGSESGRAPDRTGSSGSSTVIDFTGPQRVLEDPEPAVTGRRARHEPDDPAATPRSRRRVSWRKGSDVDEELWPVEAFGGVSDEQFWDDLATDKPLATTARPAQPDTAAKRRPPNTGPGTQPQPRLGPDDRTAIQPVQPGPQHSATSPIATQPYPAATPPSVATQPVRAAHQPAESRGRSRASADEDPLTSPAYSLRPRGSVDGRAYPSSRRSADLARGQYEAAAGQETQAFSLADTQAAGGGYPDGGPPFRQLDRPSHSGNGGRGRSDAGRPDPLRPDGYRSDPLRPDGYRSDPLRPDPLRSDPLRSDPLRSDPLRSDPLRPDPLRPDSFRPGDGTGPYPYPQQPYGEPAQPMNTPPYGERYGYGDPADQGGPAGDPRRANGGWSPGQAGGNGGGSWGSRPAYPPVNGPRGPYDPRGYDRRLTSPPGPGARRERYADQHGFA